VETEAVTKPAEHPTVAPRGGLTPTPDTGLTAAEVTARRGMGLGNSLGPARVEALLRQAGFGSVRQLRVPSLTNHFYAAGH